MGRRMIWRSFRLALSQWADPRFRRIVLLGVGLAAALLVAAYAATLMLVQWLVPETTDLPLIGPVGGLDTLVSIGSLVLMMGLSVFLMVPVASAFTGLFLEEVAQAVEDRHYPTLPSARRQGVVEGLIASVNFFGVVLVANLIALFLYPFAGPFIPVVFWAVNGWLLGQEYFTLVALRRLPKDRVKAVRRAYRGPLWLAGTLMAAPLSVPVLNLLIPVFGVATFTHIFHAIAAKADLR